MVCAVAGTHTALRWWQTAAHLHLDAMVYYGAARLSAAGRVEMIFDPVRLTAFLNELFLPGNGDVRLFLAPWLYPPIFLLVVAPLATLPFSWFYGVFQAIAVGSAALALSWRKGPASWPAFIALLASPAAVISIISGQNALLSLALILGGFRLLASHPIVAGLLLGALSYKPQLALLVPIALIAAGAWRSLAAAAGSAVLLVLVSTAVFGIEAWQAWIDELLHPPGSFSSDWLQDSVMRGYGVYVCALRLGAPGGLAAAMQLASAAIAAVAVYQVYRLHAPWELRLALLLCGAALTTPHLAPYDLVLISGAVVLLFEHSFPRGFMAGEALALGLGWVVPVIRPADTAMGAFAPLIFALVAGYAVVKVSRLRELIAFSPTENAHDGTLATRPRSDGTQIDRR